MRNLPQVYPDGLTTSPPSPPPFASPQYPFFSSIIISKSTLDLVTVVFIASLLILSLVAFSFIFYLCVRSRGLQHLKDFNSLWTVRLLLVTLASVWAINEIWSLPYVRRDYIFPHLPSLTIPQQSSICKIHVVLSLGLFQPGFLVTLLFLLNISVKKVNPSRMWVLVMLLMICVPTTLLQILFVFFPPWQGKVPKFIHGSSEVATNVNGKTTVLCAYPFMSSMVFGGFTIAYTEAFLLSCWRVLTFVINRRIRCRINIMATSVVVGLCTQVLCLSMSSMWMPDAAAYGFVVLVMFLFVAGNMAVVEIILVLRPIADAVAADSDFQQRQPLWLAAKEGSDQRRKVEYA